MKDKLLKGQKEVQQKEACRIDKLASKGYFKKGGTAIDGGAHVGSMAVKLALYFDTVIAFEPCEESYEMLVDNCAVHKNIFTWNMALMDTECTVSVHPPRAKRLTLTARQVDKKINGKTKGIAIDDLLLPECDFIKLDLEGCEYIALKGAIKTIERLKPSLLIEFNKNELGKRFGHSNRDTYSLIKSLGYKEKWRDGVDVFFECEGK